jgi:hypothetical protein
VLPKQSNSPAQDTSISVPIGSKVDSGFSGLLGGDEIEALLGLFRLLDQWDREEASRGE